MTKDSQIHGMKRAIQIVSAPSILGLRPTGVEHLPKRLLSHDLKEKIDAIDLIMEVSTLNERYSRNRANHGLINENELKEFSMRTYQAIGGIIAHNKFPLVLGGDCSIIIGIMAALKAKGTYGLIFMDAHADFYLPEQSTTGEAADCDLAIVSGRGPDSVTNLFNLQPYVKDSHIFHIGQRDADEARRYGSQNIQDTLINCVDLERLTQNNTAEIIREVLNQANALRLDGWWIHFDTDVLSDDVNPAVDYRLPGGLSFEHAEYILKTFLQSINVTGLSVTIYNPSLDGDRKVSEGITNLLANALVQKNERQTNFRGQ
jgi:arginase